MAPIRSDQPVTISLVHGTFARDAPWTRPGSKLYTALQETFPRANIEAFGWKGRNSALDRERESRRFGEWARARALAQGGAPHFVIAHSHGGNIALKALGDAAVAAAVRGVACLSTPFLHLRPRQFGATGATYLWVALAAAFTAVLLASVFELWDAIGFEPEPGAVFVALYGSAVVAALAADLMERRFARAAEQFADACALPVVARESVLILRSAGDEAAGLLMATQFLEWLIGRSWRAASASAGDFAEDIVARASRAFDGYVRILASCRVQYVVTVAVALVSLASYAAPTEILLPVFVLLGAPGLILLATLRLGMVDGIFRITRLQSQIRIGRPIYVCRSAWPLVVLGTL